MAVGSNPGKTFCFNFLRIFPQRSIKSSRVSSQLYFYVSCLCKETLLNRMTKLVSLQSSLVQIIYTWKKVREHLLCYEGKLWAIIFKKSKYALTKLVS